MTWLLIAEDSEDVREMLAEALRLHGYEVRTCSDGGEAIQMLDAATEMPAVLLLDLLMPRVSGREVLQALRGHTRARHVPVSQSWAPRLRRPCGCTIRVRIALRGP